MNFPHKSIQILRIRPIIRIELHTSPRHPYQAFPKPFSNTGPIFLIIQVFFDYSAISVQIEERVVLEVVLGYCGLV